MRASEYPCGPRLHTQGAVRENLVFRACSKEARDAVCDLLSLSIFLSSLEQITLRVVVKKENSIYRMLLARR